MKKHYWVIGIVIVTLILVILFYPNLFLYYSKLRLSYLLSSIPSPYEKSSYCDEKVGCEFYGNGEDVYCGNIYYVNITKSAGFGGMATDIECICNKTSNECITHSLRH